MRVLVIGPSSGKSKGGMATVIKEIEDDSDFCRKFNIESFASFIDGNKIKRLLYSVLTALQFFVTKRNYDIYHIHMASRGSTFRKGFYVRTAKKWNKKVVLHIHGASYMDFYKECSAKKKKRVVEILKSADLVIALSKDWKNRFDETFGLSNCVVLENGINTESLKEGISEPLNYPHQFLSLGRIGKRKGTYDLVEAVEKAKETISDIKLYIAGDGEIEKIRKFVREKNLEEQIEIVGWADFKKKIQLLKKVSTVVLPSYNEGLPMAILEGMACGKAIISSTVGAIPEVISEENGILIRPGDIEALSAAIIYCCKNDDARLSMSVKNRKKIQDFYSMTAMHERLGEYYKSV